MANKKINQLDAFTDEQANDDTALLPFADTSSGIAYKVTVAQAKQVFGVQKYKYIAVGDEVATLTITDLSGKNILVIIRETGIIFEVASAPTTSEFTWDGTDIVLGAEVSGAGERFLILFNSIALT